MYYISLDLEWNQAYYEQSIAVQKRLKTRLRGEVIQIGAVKLDENLRVCGSYSVIVKPKFFRHIHRHVMKLTGITQDMIDLGSPLPEAAERFRRWCGEDSVLFTWGPDDVPMFTDNLRAHGLSDDWIPPVYDLQVIYNMQTDGSSKQRSLEYAMEQFGIEQNLPAHDALNDAYFTAQVAAKLDMKRGIKEYESRKKPFLKEKEYGNSDIGKTGFSSPEEILNKEEISSPTCPICEAKLKCIGKLLHAKGQRYSQLFCCAEHGNIMLNVRVARNLNETLRARMTMISPDEETISTYERKLAAAATVATSHRKRRRKKKPSESAASQPQTPKTEA